jgi:hypothetical protein
MFQGIFKHERSKAFLNIFEERASSFLLQLNDLCCSSTDNEKEQRKQFLHALNEIVSWDDETIQKEKNAIYAMNPEMDYMYDFILRKFVYSYFKGTPQSASVSASASASAAASAVPLQELPPIEDFIRAFYIAISRDNGIRKGAIFEMESHKAQFIFMNAIRKALRSILKEPLSKIAASSYSMKSDQSNNPSKSASKTALSISQKDTSSSVAAAAASVRKTPSSKAAAAPLPDAVFKDYVNETIASTSIAAPTSSSAAAAAAPSVLAPPSLRNPPSAFASSSFKQHSGTAATSAIPSVASFKPPSVVLVPSVASVSTRAPTSSVSSRKKTPHTVHSFIPSSSSSSVVPPQSKRG